MLQRFLISTFIILWVWNCASEPDSIINTGTMTQTDNTIAGKVTYPDGLYAPDVEVTLRSAHYRPNFEKGKSGALLKTATVETLLEDSITQCDTICRDTTDAMGAYTLYQPDTNYTLEFRELFPKAGRSFSRFIDSLTPVQRDVKRTDRMDVSEQLIIPIPGDSVSTLVWVLGTDFFGSQIGGDTLVIDSVSAAQYVIIFFVNSVAIGESIMPTKPYAKAVPDTLPLSSSSEFIDVSSSFQFESSSSLSDIQSSAGDAREVTVPPLTRLHVTMAGNDTTGTGSIGSPLRNIHKALSMVDTLPFIEEIRVANGIYSNYGSGDSTLRVRNGVDLLGGFNDDFTERDLSFTKYVTRIEGRLYTIGTNTCGEPLITAFNIIEQTIVEGFVLDSNYTCSDNDLTFEKHGAGMTVRNSSEQLIIISNHLSNSYVSRTAENTGSSDIPGGNIVVFNSSSKVIGNYIGDGYQGGGPNGSFWILGNKDGTNSYWANNELSDTRYYAPSSSDYFVNNNLYSLYFETVYVSASDGIDESSSGGRTNPYATLDYAIISDTTKSIFIIGEGEYSVSPENVAGKIFRGGFKNSFTNRYKYPYSAPDYLVVGSDATKINVVGALENINCQNLWQIDDDNSDDFDISKGISLIGGRICQ